MRGDGCFDEEARDARRAYTRLLGAGLISQPFPA
jgi:hypothetical protein